MSDYTVIAGVSRTLQGLLRDQMVQPPPDVTVAPPDVAIAGMTGSRVNLYLYYLSENQFLKNQEIPGQGYPAAYGFPPLSLNLHYLVTAHGDSDTAADADLQAQQLLGDAMRVLHDFAVLTDGTVKTNDAGQPMLDPSLLGEFEKMKITLEPVTLDELARVWTALPNADFRLSVAYQVNVVQIESQQARSRALPVARRRIHVAVLRAPQIAAVYRTPPVGSKVHDVRVAVGQQMTIDGSNFAGPKTWVRFGGAAPVDVTPAPDAQIVVAVPNDSALSAGPQFVQIMAMRATEVVQGALDRGTVVADQGLQTSTDAPFVLVPGLSSIAPASVKFANVAATTLVLTGSRLTREGLRSSVVIGDLVTIDVPKALPPPPDTSTSVSLAPLASVLPPLVSGLYPLALPVWIVSNGAMSVDQQTLTVTAT